MHLHILSRTAGDNVQQINYINSMTSAVITHDPSMLSCTQGTGRTTSSRSRRPVTWGQRDL